ncbi:MAG: hypothetical protein ACLSD3_13015 [Acutalibacteraceae bacterium]
MYKADYKRLARGTEKSVQWTYRDRSYICTSLKWRRWAKRYLSRASRRKSRDID